jgi:hypothetical protein
VHGGEGWAPIYNFVNPLCAGVEVLGVRGVHGGEGWAPIYNFVNPLCAGVEVLGVRGVHGGDGRPRDRRQHPQSHCPLQEVQQRAGGGQETEKEKKGS